MQNYPFIQSDDSRLKKYYPTDNLPCRECGLPTTITFKRFKSSKSGTGWSNVTFLYAKCENSECFNHLKEYKVGETFAYNGWF